MTTQRHNIESITASHDLVKINGKWYRWSDIAETMDDDIREAIHFGGFDGNGIEAFWDAYVERTDDTSHDAEWLLSVIPEVDDPGQEDINADADAICNHCGKENCGCEVCGECSNGKPRCFRHEEENHD